MLTRLETVARPIVILSIANNLRSAARHRVKLYHAVNRACMVVWGRRLLLWPFLSGVSRRITVRHFRVACGERLLRAKIVFVRFNRMTPDDTNKPEINVLGHRDNCNGCLHDAAKRPGCDLAADTAVLNMLPHTRRRAPAHEEREQKAMIAGQNQRRT